MMKKIQQNRPCLPGCSCDKCTRRMHFYSANLNSKTELNQSSLLTRPQAAKYLNVCISTLDNNCRSGLIEQVKIGRLVRFRQEALDQFISENSKKRITL